MDIGLDFIEKTGKTVNDAVKEAVAALGVSEDEVDIEILDEGHKGFFIIGGRPAKVKATLKFDPVKVAEKFLYEVAEAIGVEIEVKAELKDKHLDIEISGSSMGVFIGKRGQTLDSLQYIINLAINKGNSPYISVAIDTEGYRERRKETLETLALNLAKKVKQTRASVVLEPMSSYERRTIHSALQNDKFVTTHSEGEEPYRNVVITLKREKELPKPYPKKSYPKKSFGKAY